MDQVFGLSEALHKAQALDILNYLRGLRKIELVPDRDQWNAKFDFDKDLILLEKKFLDKSFSDAVQTLLHEAGHRGQYRDKPTYEEFKRQGLNTVPNFLSMANRVHREDYWRAGIDNLAEEAFAESYARFALGLEMPHSIRRFWAERVAI